jgi:hypothetical protein
MRGFCHPNPLARKRVTKGAPSLPAITPESQVSQVERLAPGLDGASTLCIAGGADRKSLCGLRPARKISRRRVRSEIADSTAPGRVVTRRLGGGPYVYEINFYLKYHSRPHNGVQAARARRSTALTAPESTRSGPCGPGPGRPGHAGRRACPSTSASRSAPGSEIRSACGGRRGFCPIDPLARKSRTKRVSLLPVITSESQSVAGRNVGPGLLGASTPMRGQRTARKSPTLRAHRSTAGGVPVTQSRPIVGRPFGVRAVCHLCE